MERIVKFIYKIDRHDAFIMSAALAYATSLALAPFILIILSLLSFLNFDMQEKFTNQIGSALGPEVQTAVDAIVKNLQNHTQLSGISGVMGFIVLLISASAIFSNLRIAIDKINEYKIPENKTGFLHYLKNKFLSLGLVLGFAFLSIVSMLVTTFMNLLYPSSEVLFWQAIAQVVNFLLFAFLFTAIYHFVPTDRFSWKKSIFAGVISTLFFLLGKGLISSYLARAGLGSIYGAAGSLVVFLAWVYYTSLTILLSYEISLEFFFRGIFARALNGWGHKATK